MQVKIFGKSYPYRRHLVRKGFKFCGDDPPYWYKHIPENEINAPETKRLYWYLRRRRLRLHVMDANYTRSATYRQQYFLHNPDAPFRCTYCGRKLKPSNMTVDHIIPVNATTEYRRRKWWIRYLRKRGIENVNDPKNLCLVCELCNARKGKKVGLYPLLAKLGRHSSFHIIRRVLLGLLAAALGAALYTAAKIIFKF